MTAEIVETKIAYQGWAKYLVATVRQDDGQIIRREIEDHGNSVAVLAFDPERKVALLVRQLRVPVLLAAKEASLLEAIAGMREGESGEENARREAFEEAGVKLSRLEPVGTMWTTPGVSTERMDLYLAAFSGADRIGKGGGLVHEHENIAVVEMPLGELATMADRGDIADMKTFALVQTLRLRQPKLFAD